MGRHTATGDASLNIIDVHKPVKPGSRRAMRQALRAQERSAQDAVLSPAEFAQEIYAENMNKNLVSSEEIFVRTPRRAPRIFSKSRAAVVALVAVSSSLSVAAGATSYSSSHPELSAQATASLSETSAPVVKKMNLSVIADGKTYDIDALTGADVARVLDTAGIKLGSLDEISQALDTLVDDGDVITIVRVKRDSVTEQFTDKHTSSEQQDPNLPKGQRQVVTQGVDGQGTRSLLITYRDGQEVKREVIAEAITQNRVDEVVKVGTGVAATAQEAQKGQAQQAGAGAAAPASGPVSPGSNREIAQAMLASFGWGADQFPYLDALWQKESGWNQNAANRSSGAYGIPQALPGRKMASAGADWQTNPATQIRWGLGYIKGRYGSPQAAWAHSKSTGWY
ncbi:G5 domain-containing protein [Arcanobacterium bovis]|uniref:DUF348 domain-containing protein n=1 Tax=Arcanobacterium bovis TaxID=2529275 RepID=A0A4Q9V3N9_9ACTO|nr:G5 domain-containing protein [Arcanobacterium bovis]TBW23733.1 DUF348 domain-containing protein [Arcanobacterium bovis]